jgi:hypothetical protein
MTEEQLRDVLARVVPEPPDSVADPGPVVRAARVRRRTQVALAGGAVAVIAVAAVVGGRALTDDSAPQVAEEPSISADPYAAAACPAVLPESGPLPDLSEVTAVRFCAAGFNGFSAQPGPPEALVEGIDDLDAAIADIPEADPARCAAVDVVPSDSRLAFRLTDGSLAFVPATMCQNVTVAGTTIDGGDLSQAFVNALDGQRDDYSYTSGSDEELTCQTPASLGPAAPWREHVIAAVFCPAADLEATGTPITDGALAELADAWSSAEQADPMADCLHNGEPSSVLVLTERGDVVRLAEGPCGYLEFYGWKREQPAYWVKVLAPSLIAS